MKLFNRSWIPEGKEGKHLLISTALFLFWTISLFADLFDGAIKFRGNSTPTAFVDHPFWVGGFAVIIIWAEVYFFWYLCTAILAFLERNKGSSN